MDQLKKLYIEPTSNCNLQCEMCFRHTWFGEKFCDLDFDLFMKVLETMPHETRTVFFGGMGEPLFHHKIIDMVAKCSQRNLNVELLTNGTLLNEDFSKDLMDAGLNKLWVSMDTLEPAGNNGMGHPMAESILERIKTFNRVRYLNHFAVKLGITFVATKSNVSQLAHIPYFIERYGISDVNVSNLYPSDKVAWNESLYQRTLSMSIGSDVFGSGRPVVDVPYMDFDLPEVKEGLSGMFSRMNFNLKVSGVPVPRRSQFCPFINDGTSFVRSDGEVSPCMALLHNGTTVLGDTERKVYHHSFGNINESGLKDIWESDDYVRFRERVLEFSFSPCMNCGHCSYPEENETDCFGNIKPTCGACLWSEGLLSCP